MGEVKACANEIKVIRKEVAEVNVRLDTAVEAKLTSEDSEVFEQKLNDKVKVVKEDLAEKMEIEKRKQNLVVWGLKENDTTSDEPKSKDIEAVKEMLKSGLKVDADKHVLEVQRIGKFEQGKVRPLRVKINTLEGRTEIMTRAWTLKDSVTCKNIYISPDLTKRQQKVDKELRDKLKEIRVTNQNARIKQGRIIERDSNGHVKVLFTLENDGKYECTTSSKNGQCLRNSVTSKK